MNTKLTCLIRVVAILFIAGIIFSCSSGNGDNKANNEQSIMVFAGASLTDVLTEIVDSFEVKYKVQVKTNMASSGTLARQIEQGAAPDVYISASRKWANYVDSLGCVLENYKSDIAQNKLVLVAPESSTLKVGVIDSTLDFTFLLGKGRLSIGDPSHVPAGKYAKQALEYFGWYEPLENKMLRAKDVRSALMVVEMEEAPLGTVYKTDALKSTKVKILGEFPEKSHQPIVFVASVCNKNKTAKDFWTFLNSDETKPIWEKYGFTK